MRKYIYRHPPTSLTFFKNRSNSQKWSPPRSQPISEHHQRTVAEQERPTYNDDHNNKEQRPSGRQRKRVTTTPQLHGLFGFFPFIHHIKAQLTLSFKATYQDGKERGVFIQPLETRTHTQIERDRSDCVEAEHRHTESAVHQDQQHSHKQRRQQLHRCQLSLNSRTIRSIKTIINWIVFVFVVVVVSS